MILTLSKVRYAAMTPSRAPDWHSWMNSARLVAVGRIRSAMSEREDQVVWALLLLLLLVLVVGGVVLWCGE